MTSDPVTKDHDLISRQAAIKAILKVPDGNWSQKRYAQEIRKQPSVDTVPVVRCKDCKHYQFADNRAFGFPVKRCEWTGFEDVDDEDFCSRGERKDGERA